MVAMTVIKINAITVPEGSGDELARRFAPRAGAVDGQDGFEGFALAVGSELWSYEVAGGRPSGTNA